ncbi:ATP-binding protein [Patescibacteria group bacterium]|nr:ATP-binding protein [Patescibacteria group bacterium]MBU4422003.1 ATP-binding protein [Patescibacteria group bacterium]
MLYPRKITQELKNWLFEKEIIILNGPRQVGKTSILKLIEQELTGEKIKKEQIFYLNLEEIKILDTLNNDPENIFKYVINPEEKNYFFIDEIQYLDNPSNFLKHLYDKYAGKIKIIATGLSSLELKAKFQDSLAGRKVSFAVNPLDFEEFLNFKNFPYLDYLKKKELPLNIKSDFDNNLSEYLVYGGMPAITLQKNKTLKEKMLDEYVNAYINKDIRAIGKIENIAYFNNLMKILASQIGNLLNINELSNTTGISRRDIEKYLDLLEFTFVLDKISPFRKNARTQVTKMPKIYFFDLGVRNAILGNFLDIESRQDIGSLFENFVFLELKNKAKNKIFFYRTVAKTEIDFIIEKKAKIVLMEAKYKKLAKPIDTRILQNFMERESNAKKAAVVNLNFNYKDGSVEYTDYRFINV